MQERELEQLRNRNVQTVRDFYRYGSEKNADKLNRLWAEDAVMYTMYSIPPVDPEIAPPKIEGAEAVRKFWAGFVNSAQRSTVNVHHVDAFADPEYVLARFTTDIVTGDGTPYKNEEACLLRLKDGKIVEYLEYSNPLVILESFMKGRWVTGE